LLSFLLSCSGLAAARADSPKFVVVLYPHNSDGIPGNALVDQGIRPTFASGSLERIEVYNEYLDTARAPDAAQQQLQVDYLRRKYAGRRVDLVIAGLSSGLDFALRYREEIFPGVPIVFCAVDEREVRSRKLPRDVVGVPLKTDMPATLDLALRFHPHTEQVFVIAGKDAFDAFWEAEARKAFHAYEDKLEFVYLSGLPMLDLLRTTADLPDRSIIYYLHVLQDGTGKSLVLADVLQELASAANVPIYGHLDSYVGRGIVGGRVWSFEAEGKNAARLGLRILAGERPESIGVRQTSENSYLFDWRQLRRWGIREDDLPPDSDVRFRDESFWAVHKWTIIGVTSLCVTEALLIIGLLVQRMNRRRAEKRFRQVVESVPIGMVMIGEDGNIILANAYLQRLFGYRKEEMLGRPVEMLVPERFRGEHPAQRARFLASPEPRLMGEGGDLFGRRKDGSEFPVEIGLTPVRSEQGTSVLATIIDITQRRLAERALEASERRYRTLFDNANDAIFLETENDDIIGVNQRACDLLGYSREELLAMKVPNLQAPEVRGLPGTVIKGELATHQDHAFEGLDVHRNGRRIPVEITDAVIEENGGRFVLSIVRDITERKQAEDALRESEARFRLMADAAPILVWASGPDKACTYFNRPWLEFTGRSLEQELGNGWAESVHADDMARCLKVYTTHFDARQPFEVEYRLRRHDGEYRWILDRGVPRHTPSGEFAGYIGACIDVTDRKHAEQELRTSYRRQQNLASRLLTAQESERRRIARELHDDLSQGLALLAVEMEVLSRKPPETVAQVAECLQELAANVKELSSSVHDLSHRLHPSKLEQLGLVASVGGLCKELTQAKGLPIVFAPKEVPDGIPEHVALCLYRIVQEALGNIIKHSGARHATVELTGPSDSVCLRVIDDGDGFDPNLTDGKGGLGLVSMRERLRLVGGELAIHSRLGGGTRIEVRVPLHATGQPHMALKRELAGI
jgi:PAS domain S-box-containing protein